MNWLIVMNIRPFVLWTTIFSTNRGIKILNFVCFLMRNFSWLSPFSVVLLIFGIYSFWREFLKNLSFVGFPKYLLLFLFYTWFVIDMISLIVFEEVCKVTSSKTQDPPCKTHLVLTLAILKDLVKRFYRTWISVLAHQRAEVKALFKPEREFWRNT